MHTILDVFELMDTIQNILMTCWLIGERSLPFGLLVYVKCLH